MLSQTPKNKGYTLIEILVTLTILGILFGFAYANFRGFSRRQELESITDKVVGELRDIQQNAISGVKPNNPYCNSPNTLLGHSFFVSGTTSYVLSAVCSGGNVSVKSITIPIGYTISSSSSPIIFKVLS